MKRIHFLTSFVILILTTVSGFSQESKVDLKSPEVQSQVFNQIINDRQLMHAFMDTMKTNNETMNVTVSDMGKKCHISPSDCNHLFALVAKHNDTLNRLKKFLDEREASANTAQSRPKYRHR
jgi:hypothetical protein